MRGLCKERAIRGSDATTLRIRNAKASIVATDSDGRRCFRAFRRRVAGHSARRVRAPRVPSVRAVSSASDRFLACVFERR
jgi:hypothetical protein